MAHPPRAIVPAAAAARFFVCFHQWSTAGLRSHAAALQPTTLAAAQISATPSIRLQRRWHNVYACKEGALSVRGARFRSVPAPAAVKPSEWGTPLSQPQRHAARSSHSQASPHTSVPRIAPNTTINAAPPNDPADLSTHMRLLMRQVPHPVTIITASRPLPAASPALTPESAFCGMTVSSFNTVTLSPAPIVSFNVKTPSATYTALKASGGFLAHVMAASAQGAVVADAFARGRAGEVFEELSRRRGAWFRVMHGAGTRGAPMIAGQGVLRVMRCRVLEGKEVRVGDHVVVVGEVEGILGLGQGDEGERGLVYVDGAYRRVGALVDMEVVDGPEVEKGLGEEVQRTIGLNVRRGDEGIR